MASRRRQRRSSRKSAVSCTLRHSSYAIPSSTSQPISQLWNARFMMMAWPVIMSNRCCVMGRTSAFLSDAEYQYVLHGMRRTVAGTAREVDWPDYNELELQPFTTDQIRQFLVGYSRHLVSRGRIDPARADPEYLLMQINRLP